MLPRLMFPYPEDIIQVPPPTGAFGKIDIFDASTIVNTFGTQPGDPLWHAAADVNDNREIELFDALSVRAVYEWQIQLPLPYCSEGGRLNPPP